MQGIVGVSLSKYHVYVLTYIIGGGQDWMAAAVSFDIMTI